MGETQKTEDKNSCRGKLRINGNNSPPKRLEAFERQRYATVRNGGGRMEVGEDVRGKSWAMIAVEVRARCSTTKIIYREIKRGNIFLYALPT